MNNTTTYNQCPVCRNTHIAQALDAEDYTVSHEIFEIWHCNNCSCRFTQHVPAAGDIDKYYQSSAYISHSDTKSGLINRLYHIVRGFTLHSKRRLVEKESGKTKAHLLDVGSGTGAFAAAMQLAGWNVTGLEPDATARANALKNHNLRLQEMDNIFSLEKESFDVITLWHVLEHVHQLHEYIHTFQHVLKEDGTLIIAVPNYTSYDAKKYGRHWAAYDVPRHLYHFSPRAMVALMKHNGFAVSAHKPMWFDSFYVSMLSEKYTAGSSNLLRAVWTGLRSNLKALNNPKRCSSVIYIVKKQPVNEK